MSRSRGRQVFSIKPGIERLHGLLVFAAAVGLSIAGCPLPITPGCGADQHLPSLDSLWSIALVRSHPAIANFRIDAAGRSDFVPAHTAWMLRTGRVCRSIPEKELQNLKSAWAQVGFASAPMTDRGPDRPFLWITYSPGGTRREFRIEPGEVDTPPPLQRAVSLTLDVLQQTYGERFSRELDAAGLASLRALPPVRGP